MVIAVNDISFLWGFDTPHQAQKALIQFGCVVLGLRDERVSNVDEKIDIINSTKVHKAVQLAPNYKLIDALLDIKVENYEQFLFTLQILSQCGEEEDGCNDEFVVAGHTSKHCARYRDSLLLSLISDEIFQKETIKGTLNGKEACEIRNISDESHKYVYWDKLGFREYELNEKHGSRVYYRCGGYKVNIAPETDELGQKLLNHVVAVGKKLFAVDHEKGNRIFEFQHSYANKFHGYLCEDLSADFIKKIMQKDKEVNGKR